MKPKKNSLKIYKKDKLKFVLNQEQKIKLLKDPPRNNYLQEKIAMNTLIQTMIKRKKLKWITILSISSKEILILLIKLLIKEINVISKKLNKWKNKSKNQKKKKLI